MAVHLVKIERVKVREGVAFQFFFKQDEPERYASVVVPVDEVMWPSALAHELEGALHLLQVDPATAPIEINMRVVPRSDPLSEACTVTKIDRRDDTICINGNSDKLHAGHWQMAP